MSILASATGLGSLLWSWPLPNVWLGTSVENQHWADIRLPELLATPAAVRFVSHEPSLGPVVFDRWLKGGYYLTPDPDCPGDSWMLRIPKLDWVIVGGESGRGARPFDLAWARSVVEQCRAAGVACFVKQLGSQPREHYQDTPSFRATGVGGNDWPVDIAWAGGKGNPPLANPNREPDWWKPCLKDHKGGDMTEWPADLRVREMPRC